ncbi:MAG TPA: HAMP domain-containing sensor histidine kinase [Candidatus Kryptonia bacterium]|nr:HAMP domain-containing sensor histidine kinase [Candidatus Kryptonia bacterium]
MGLFVFQPSAAATDAELLQTYRDEMRRLVASRTLLAWGVLLSFLLIACSLSWLYFPERTRSSIGLFAIAFFIGMANVRLVRVLPTRAVGLSALATITLCLALCAYFVFARPPAELCVMALMIFLTGLVVMFPWGLGGQAPVSVAAVLGYLLALKQGTVPFMPAPYGVLTLTMSAFLTAMGAQLIDRHRFEAYRNAEASERANAAKSEFLATVSHELRTPLTVIIGYTDLMLDETIAPLTDHHDALQRIRDHSAELLDLIQSMLDLNRLEGGGIQLLIEEFRLGDLFDSLRQGLPANWSKPAVRLAWPIDVPNVVMRSDRQKIEVIVRNLIHNALKYTDEGTVTVAARSESRFVHLTVTDTGSGIAAEDLQCIFEIFQQSRRQAPRGGGVGLGLYIVKRFTEALGGTVGVDSRPGSGARFSVSLPIVAPPMPGALSGSGVAT